MNVSRPTDTAETHPESVSLTTDDSVVERQPANIVLFSDSLFEGSPAYKQRRKKSKRGRHHRGGTVSSQYDTGDEESGSEAGSVHQSEMPFSSGRSGVGVPPSLNRHPAETFFEPIPRHTSHLAATTSSLGTMLQPNPVDPRMTARHMQAAQSGLWSGLGQFAESNESANSMPTYVSPDLDNTSSSLALSGGGEGGDASSSVLAANRGFSCPLLSCGRVFKRLEHLKRHVRTHTQERPYECSRCSKRFSRSDNLTQHIKTHEKADRGERLKTEVSENTEDEMASYLEAEVDAMAVREGRGLGAIGDVKNEEEAFPYAVGDDVMTGGKLSCFSSFTRSFAEPQASTACTTQHDLIIRACTTIAIPSSCHL